MKQVLSLIQQSESDPEKNKLLKFSHFAQRKLEKINDAIDENLLDRFVLKELECQCPHKIGGQIKGNNKEYIFLEIDEKDIKHVKIGPKYEIDFLLNRVPYQVQHMALDYVKKHKLVERLINNPLLSVADSANSHKCPSDAYNVPQLKRFEFVFRMRSE